MRKLNPKLLGNFIQFRKIYQEYVGFGLLSYSILPQFDFFNSLSDSEFYQILRATGVISSIFSKENRRILVPSQIDKNRISLKSQKFQDFLNESQSYLVVNLGIFWAQNSREMFELSARIMCRNQKGFPDIGLAMEILLILAWEIKSNKLEEIFHLEKKHGVGAILGHFLSYFISV